MAKGFFISIDSAELKEAVLIIASHAKGGVTEWLEMSSDEFIEWLDALKRIHRDGGK